MTTVFLLVSILLALALVCAPVAFDLMVLMKLVQWIRPPSITIGSVQTMSGSTGSGVRRLDSDLF